MNSSDLKDAATEQKAVRDRHGDEYRVENFDKSIVYFSTPESDTYCMGRSQFEREFEVVEQTPEQG